MWGARGGEDVFQSTRSACVCDVNDHVSFFCRLNNLMCCGNRGKFVCVVV